MKIKELILLLIVILVSFGSVLPLFESGFFSFHDDTTVVRMYEMGKSLGAGMFPVRWVEGLGYGYGYPIFNFYAPFPYYLGGVLSLIGIDLLISTKIALIVGMVLSGVTMFYLSKKYFGEIGGVVSAIVYVYYPYHAVNLYVRGAVGELFAYAFLPVVFLGLTRLFAENNKQIIKQIPSIIIFSLGVFFIAISHNLSYLMTILLIIPVTVFATLWTHKRLLFALLVLGSVILGTILASFYILPAFVEMGYTNVRSQVGGGADFRDHFVCFGQFWESGWGFGGSTKDCVDGLSFRLGKTNILLFLISLGLAAFATYKKNFRIQEKIAVLALIIAVLAIFLTQSVSRPLWEAISYMEYLQYPWRFVNFIALGMSLGIGYLFYFLQKKLDKRAGVVIAMIVIAATIGFNFKLFQPQFINGNTSDYYKEKNYINYTVSKISDEYLPEGFDKPENAESIPREKLIWEGMGTVRMESQTVSRIRAMYDANTSGVLHINTAYFPAWHARINGQEARLIQVDDGMELEIPAGQGEIEIFFKQTGVQKVGNALSLLAFLVIIVGIMLQKSYGKKTS